MNLTCACVFCIYTAYWKDSCEYVHYIWNFQFARKYNIWQWRITSIYVLCLWCSEQSLHELLNLAYVVNVLLFYAKLWMIFPSDYYFPPFASLSSIVLPLSSYCCKFSHGILFFGLFYLSSSSSCVFLLSSFISALWERNPGNCCLSRAHKNTKYSWSEQFLRAEHCGGKYYLPKGQLLESYFIQLYNWSTQMLLFSPSEACFIREVCRADYYCCKPWFKGSLDIISGNVEYRYHFFAVTQIALSDLDVSEDE